ncbi:MAG: hypothetical protein ACR5K9_10230 [Wolbachia sp.]
MGYVINLLNFPIIAKKSSFSFVPLPMKLGISVTSMSSIIEKFRTRNLFIPPNAIEIENSNMSIKEVAGEITSQMYRLSQIDRVYAKG